MLGAYSQVNTLAVHDTLRRLVNVLVRLGEKIGRSAGPETLCKILCHNLVVPIHETHELGIDPVFWSSEAV
jgi:hypothetical protein